MSQQSTTMPVEPDRVDEDSEESSEETETYPCTESDADGCED